MLTENNSSITSVDLFGYDAPTSTVQVTVTTDAADPAARDGVAFFVTDVMAYLWVESEPHPARPTRRSDPRLEVTVDGVIYGTPFDVMVEVADYTITRGRVAGDRDRQRRLRVRRQARPEGDGKRCDRQRGRAGAGVDLSLAVSTPMHAA